jgi:hypothetical protein
MFLNSKFHVLSGMVKIRICFFSFFAKAYLVLHTGEWAYTGGGHLPMF